MKLPKPELNDRARDAGTGALIEEALHDWQSEKELKRASNAATGAKRPRKSLEDVEDADEGPVKENQVEWAASQRSYLRQKQRAKGRADDDLEAAVGVEQYEETFEPGGDEDEAGFEPFNLKAEREEGYFDEEGNYVFNKKGDDEDKDAWLASAEVAVLDESARKRIRQRQAALDEAEASGPLGEVQIARLKGELGGLIQPEETVLQALRRLGGKKGEPKTKAGARKQTAMDVDTGGQDKEDRAAFLHITELADQLLNSGELDVYSIKGQLLLREAAVYGGSLGGVSNGKTEKKEEAQDDDFDMFGDESPKRDEPCNNEGSEQPHQPEAPQGDLPGPPAESKSPNQPSADHSYPANGGSAAEGEQVADEPQVQDRGAGGSEVDEYASWPVKELRRFLTERGQDTSGVLDKTELVGMVRALASQGPDGAPPPGYVYEPNSGYYYNSSKHLYWHPGSDLYYSSTSQKWYKLDPLSGQMSEWTGV